MSNATLPSTGTISGAKRDADEEGRRDGGTEGGWKHVDIEERQLATELLNDR
jgi:hypothetical protein